MRHIQKGLYPCIWRLAGAFQDGNTALAESSRLTEKSQPIQEAKTEGLCPKNESVHSTVTEHLLEPGRVLGTEPRLGNRQNSLCLWAYVLVGQTNNKQ